jgi:protein-tyrosine phosphatase
VIDIHHHCLPGVDDGPRELSESVEMCRLAADEGIDTIVATPHVLRGRWKTFRPQELAVRLERLREAVGDAPRLLLGSEYFFGHDVADVLRAGDAIIPLAESRYVLVEFPSNNVPPHTAQPFYRMQLEGWTPVIAHPERNIVFQSKPELLASMIEAGARTQITAASLIGEFGPEAQRACEAWLRRGLVHLVATDAHNVGKRPPRVRRAIERLRELAGDAVAEALTVGNPRAILENRGLEYEPDPAPSVSDGFFTRVRRFLRRP